MKSNLRKFYHFTILPKLKRYVLPFLKQSFPLAEWICRKIEKQKKIPKVLSTQSAEFFIMNYLNFSFLFTSQSIVNIQITSLIFRNLDLKKMKTRSWYLFSCSIFTLKVLLNFSFYKLCFRVISPNFIASISIFNPRIVFAFSDHSTGTMSVWQQ